MDLIQSGISDIGKLLVGRFQAGQSCLFSSLGRLLAPGPPADVVAISDGASMKARAVVAFIR
jgi:hypothetical protein